MRRALAAALVVLAARASEPSEAAVDATVPLRAPLTTVIALPRVALGDGAAIDVEVALPDGVADAGVGAFIGDRAGQWFQTPECRPLRSGSNRVRLRLAADAPLAGEPTPRRWTPALAAESTCLGLFVYATRGAGAVAVRGRVRALAPVDRPRARLDEIRAPDRVAAGERWQVDCLPRPFPRNPFDPDECALEARIVGPDGERVVPGFWWEPMRSIDRGDREAVVADGFGRFSVRFRPQAPGDYRVRLVARWRGGAEAACELPLRVDGAPWDGFVRVDRRDPRFFALGDAWFWPVGLNLRSPNDERGHEHLGTRLTPDLGTFAYDAYLRRFAAGGVDAVEVWLAAWNLGLEWSVRGGFPGLGRYDQRNAWRLERVLDDALAHGVRVDLVIANHGQASASADREWQANPYAAANGGPATGPADYFTDPRALALQDRYRRYLVARYADHPAIFAWKLFSEVNLTAVGNASTAWHRQAAARWRALDVYGHPVTTHWSDDYRSADAGVVGLRDIGFACIDAYYRRDLLADVLAASTQNRARGLRRFGKPTLVTEFGGNEFGGAAPQLTAELASAGFAALVSGHAGMPMFWWWEWVDQRDDWGPFRAVRAFIAREDCRDPLGGSVGLDATAADRSLWCRVWRRPGRMLGYVLDPAWGRGGGDDPVADAAIGCGDTAAGAIAVEWWDADAGANVGTVRFAHPGGPLVLRPPTFRGHLAFKLMRIEPADAH